MNFKDIKAKVTTLSDKLSREEGAKDQLTEQLKTLLTDPKATLAIAKDRRKALGEKKDKLEIQFERAMSELEAVTDWSKV